MPNAQTYRFSSCRWISRRWALRSARAAAVSYTHLLYLALAGVQHEFSTIPGVKEDVTEIVLNIKGIIAKRCV